MTSFQPLLSLSSTVTGRRDTLAAIWKDYVYHVVLDKKQLDILTAHAAWRLESGNHPPGATMPDFSKVIFTEPLASIAPDRVALK